MADQAVRPSSDAVEPAAAPACAGAPSTSSSPPSWASPSASSSGPGTWSSACSPRRWHFFPPLSAILNGVYLMPGVVAGLLVRKPGAAVFASTLAAAVSLLLGSPYGLIIVVYGLRPGARRRAGLPAHPLPALRLGDRRPGRGHRGPLDVDPRPEPLLPGVPGVPVLGVHAAVHGVHRDLERAARRRRRPAAGPGPGPHRRAELVRRRPHARLIPAPR